MSHPPHPCVVCGTVFSPPYHPNNRAQVKKTCSKECFQELQRKNHLGPRNKWWKHGGYSKVSRSGAGSTDTPIK